MPLSLPSSQNPFDWCTQYWNVCLGKKVDFSSDSWLLGSIGKIGESSEQFINRLVDERKASIDTESKPRGLLESVDSWGEGLCPEIKNFYLQTSDYDFAVQALWKPVFASMGYLVASLFSRRIQQLNLPQGKVAANPLEFRSEIIKLRDAQRSDPITVWRRTRTDTEEVVFFGIYSECCLPSGENCIKAIFPLPRGSATVILRPEVDENGYLTLVSSGKSFGDPGFYFLVEDCNGCLWRHYLPSFREKMHISLNQRGEIEAEHTLHLWALKVYEMHYQIRKTS